MSIETANAARFKKGMTALSPLEGELLEALIFVMTEYSDDILTFYGESVKFDSLDEIEQADRAIANAHGSSPDCEAS